MSDSLQAVVGRSDDPEKVMADRIYLSLWENQGYLPDPVQHAFREAMVLTAMQICHECGTEEDTVKFCAETIAEWMKHDTPNAAVEARRNAVASDGLLADESKGDNQ